MEIKMVAPSMLVASPHNARTHPTWQISKIAESITEFGFISPVILDDDETVIAGHGRVLAAMQLGIPEIPSVSISHLSEQQVRAYIIADNQLATLSEWDDEILSRELIELQESGYDLELTALSEPKIAELLGIMDTATNDPEHHYVDMPEYKNNDLRAFRTIHVHFEDENSLAEFLRVNDRQITDKTKYLWFPEQSKDDRKNDAYISDGS